jgi:exosortase/archaeosortase family protein
MLPQASPGRIKQVWVGLLVLGALILAVEPAVWLVKTWLDPVYDSHGMYVFGAVAGLFVWSSTSPKRADATEPPLWTYLLLAGTGLIRLAGQLLAVDILGAAALAVDVYAVGRLSGLDQRQRAIDPRWLALLFLFCLPTERVLQRVVGYPLQHISAVGSCGLLSVFFDDLACSGVEMTLAGRHILVDVPCSGARGLVLIASLFCGLAAVGRPGLRGSLTGLSTAGFSALAANVLRVSLLGVGIAHPAWFGGVDVMRQPWHDLVGLGALAVGCLPLIVWFRLLPPEGRGAEPPPASETTADSAAARPSRSHLLGGLVFVLAAIGITLAPGRPVDVSGEVESIHLPATIAGHTRRRQPLSELEQDYYAAWGGAAAKASYGPQSLLVVRTDSPLRHLHSPEECLRGAGWQVESTGITYGRLPGASYRAVSPDGHRWRVRVTYTSSDGRLATSIGEVAWRWLQNPEVRWRAVERIYPADRAPRRVARFEQAVMRALELPSSRSLQRGLPARF